MKKRALKFSLVAVFYLLFFSVRVLYPAQSTVPPVVDFTAEKKFVVIIDPGHGGGDWGVSVKGVHEKDINLDLAKRIKTKIEKSGRNITVFLTRTGDELLKPEDRAGFANQKKGSLFISIHCDYARSDGAEGYKVFYESGEQEATAADQGLKKWDEVQKYRINGSRKLAKYILQYLQAALIPEGRSGDENDLLQMKSRKSRAAHLGPLESVDMPAIVLEAGNLNNSGDFADLKDERILDRMAYHIKEGVINYLKEAASGDREQQQ